MSNSGQFPSQAAKIEDHPLRVSMPVSSLSVDVNHLPKEVHDYIEEKANICQPDAIYICDGSIEEYNSMLKILEDAKIVQRLEKMKTWYELILDQIF